jgi:L-ribulose-5-phosphate 3-epimerase UlaE
MLGYDIDYASYGLDNPVICVQPDLENGSMFEVKIGKELEKGFYAIATGRDFVYLVAKDGIEALDEVLRELSP